MQSMPTDPESADFSIIRTCSEALLDTHEAHGWHPGVGRLNSLLIIMLADLILKFYHIPIM